MTKTTEAVVMVSNFGRVKRLEYKKWNKKNQSYSIMKEKEYAYLTNKGKQRHEINVPEKYGKYVHVDIRGKGYAVHRLVAQAFLLNPDNLPQVHHKNENRSDNRAANLEWVTNEENQQRKSDDAKIKKIKKLTRFSKKDASIALQMRISGKTTKQISEIYGVSHETIRLRTNEIATCEQKIKIQSKMRELSVAGRIKTMRKAGLVK